MNKFDKNYFKKYQQKNIFGLDKGEKPFLYLFWKRKLKKMLSLGSKVLEVGCGCGYFLKRIDKIFDTYGADYSKEALELARRITKAKLFLCNAEKLPFKNESFSAVIAFDLIEHLTNPEIFLKETFRVLKNNGFLILSTPNPKSIGARLKNKLTPGIENLPYDEINFVWYGWRDKTHINIKTLKEWRRIIESCGFKILKDGTDTLWDVPYFRFVPNLIQKLIFMSLHWILTFIFGFFPWNFGENYICIAKKTKG